MKILYGIQGTGNGHLARARALVPELRTKGIEMDFVFSGRVQGDYFNMDVFQEGECLFFAGLSLMTERGKLNTFKTITKNNQLQFFRDVINLDVTAYDLVISDFEPITAWAAKLRGKHSIGISHQCAFLYAIPKSRGYTIAKILMRIFAPTKINLGLHWYHFNQPILPPLIEPHTLKPATTNKIIVYMGFEAIQDIIQLLMPFSNYQFIVYAKVNIEEQQEHIIIKPLSNQFHEDLEESDGVISNAGFELASECLQLGKKLLIKPLGGQYEQLSNALALELMDRATVMNSLDHNILKMWLEEPTREPIAYPNVAAGIAEWLCNNNWKDPSSLVSELWNGVDTGKYFSNLLEKTIKI